MKKVKVEAKSKGAIIGTGDATQFESLKEAAQLLGSEEKALGIINLQMRIRALDIIRRGTAGPSLTKLYKTASPEVQEKIKKLLEAEMAKRANT